VIISFHHDYIKNKGRIKDAVEIYMLPTEERFQLRLKVSPSASRSEVVNFIDDSLLLKVAAPPTKGKANKEVISFLSKKLRLPKSSIQIVAGHTTRQKLVNVYGMEKQRALHKLIKK
jgi:uncharacterized protein (TIGR00251 family)